MIRVGDKVKVNSLADPGDSEATDRVGATGIVKGNRIVDGSGIGHLVEFDDKTVAWFFAKELAAV